MKNCKEIQADIDDLKAKIRRGRSKKIPVVDGKPLSEQAKCDSDTPHMMCSNCNCWKMIRD
jgi:hypothetical protein